MSEETSRVLEKMNAMIQEILDYDAAINAKKSAIRQCLKEINCLAGKEICTTPKKESLEGKQSEVFQFLKDFFLVLRKIHEDDAFIKYIYKTKQSANYYKVGQETFESYINQYSYTEPAVFLNYCVDLSLVKAEANRKCVYDSGEERVYYIGKSFADAAIREVLLLNPGGV